MRHHISFMSSDELLPRLLLGIDEEKKQVACGLVDTIGERCSRRKVSSLTPFPGSYTFAKTLEYKAKHNLQSGKEVTVIPPVEYQERFVHALEDYFVVCPGMWFVFYGSIKSNQFPS